MAFTNVMNIVMNCNDFTELETQLREAINCNFVKKENNN